MKTMSAPVGNDPSFFGIFGKREIASFHSLICNDMCTIESSKYNQVPASTPGGNPSETVREGVLKVAVQPIVQTDPALISSDSQVLIADHVYDYLVDIGHDIVIAGYPFPGEDGRVAAGLEVLMVDSFSSLDTPL